MFWRLNMHLQFLAERYVKRLTIEIAFPSVCLSNARELSLCGGLFHESVYTVW